MSNATPLSGLPDVSRADDRTPDVSNAGSDASPG